jgi:hypothetical protein
MFSYTIVADRKMSGCTGNDLYVEFKNVEHFKDIWTQVDTGIITTINNEIVTRQGNMIKFQLVDNFTKKKYSSNIGNISNGIRFRITDYSNAIDLLPSQILYITMDINGSNCDLCIKAEWFYKYILKRVPGETDKYYLEEEHCDKMNPSTTLNNYLNQFNINLAGRSHHIGRSQITYQMYNLTGCRNKYIGVPFDTSLEVDCFNEIEEIL